VNRILVPLDGSDFSAQVLDTVKKTFAPQACEVILYNVAHRPDVITGYPPRPAAYEVTVPMYENQQDIELAHHPIYETQQEDAVIDTVKQTFEPTAQPLRSAGYRVKVEVDFGNAAEAIIERSRVGDVDLVAMTTHGRSGISRLLFGSVAEQVVRHVAVPVLLVRPNAEPNTAGAAS
jgi:nucleotide-binding universal stress UspA family protein